MSIEQTMLALGERARRASRAVMMADAGQKNRALLAMAEALAGLRPELREANAADVADAKAAGLDAAPCSTARRSPSATSTTWAKACARSPPCPTRWAASPPPPCAPTACAWRKCASRWASSASSTSRAPTSPSTPPPCA